jgi:hypothetical protein
VSRRKGQTAPRAVCIGLRARAWWVIRKHKRVTLNDLLATLADGGQKDAYNNLRQYLRGLVKAGVMEHDATRQPGEALTSNGHIRFRLKQDLGAKAPVLRKDGVFDPNGKRLIEFDSHAVQEEAPSQSEQALGGAL